MKSAIALKRRKVCSRRKFVKIQKKNYKRSSHKSQTAPKMIRGCVCGLCGPFYFVILIRMDVKFQG